MGHVERTADIRAFHVPVVRIIRTNVAIVPGWVQTVVLIVSGAHRMTACSPTPHCGSASSIGFSRVHSVHVDRAVRELCTKR